MRGFRHLRTRLVLAYTGLIVIGFAGLALLAGQQISSSAIVDYQRSLESQAQLVARGLREPLEHYFEGEATSASLADLLQAYEVQTGSRITLFDTEGRAWLDTHEVVEENAAVLPEIRAALAGRSGSDIRSDEHRVTTLYVAAPIPGEDELKSGVVRLAIPLSQTNQAILNRWLMLGGSVLLLAALSIIAGLLLARSLSRPLEELRASALRLAAGDFSTRLPESRADEIGELARTFNYLSSEVQSMLEEQRAFVSNASHELRTPLTTIRLRSEALRRGALEPDIVGQYIVEIDDEVTRLSSLVNDLMLLSQLDAKRADPNEEQLDPLRVMRSLLHEVSSQTEAKHISLQLESPESLPIITANLTHLHTVFRNVLDNAIKYTPEGGSITWSLSSDPEWLNILVKDNGQGIDPAELPHVTKRFYRTDRARTRSIPGAGLGLALVSSIVEFYGGSIEIDSAGLGCGTTILIRWPRTPVHHKIDNLSQH